jgi:hypothetical protein
VPEPGDDRSLGPLLDRNAFGASDRAAPDRRGMIRDSTGQPVGEVGVICMKAQERDHRSQKIFDVLGLGFVTAAGIGILLLCETLRGSLGVEVGTNPLNSRWWCPNAP